MTSPSPYGNHSLPFGTWLADQIAQRGWNQPEFARRADVKPATVYRWVVGERAPTPTSVKKVAEVLGRDLDEVLTIAGHRSYVPKDETEQVIDELRPLLDQMNPSERGVVVAVAQGQAALARIRHGRNDS